MMDKKNPAGPRAAELYITGMMAHAARMMRFYFLGSAAGLFLLARPVLVWTTRA